MIGSVFMSVCEILLGSEAGSSDVTLAKNLLDFLEYNTAR